MGASTKDSGLALIIEIVGGIFGLLGLGYLYAGLTTDGIIRLISWWVVIAIVIIIILVTAGLAGFCLGPLMIIPPIVSGIMLKDRLDKGV